MKKIILYILLTIVVIITGFIAYVFLKPVETFVPNSINEIPMYGRESYEQHIKERSEEHRIADEQLINTLLSSGNYKNTREASDAFCLYSNEYFNSGDYSTAIKRNNQAWLLDHTNPCVYANYGYHYMFAEMKIEKSIEMYEKAKTFAIESKDDDLAWILLDYAEVKLYCYSEDDSKKDCLNDAYKLINESKQISEIPKTFRSLAFYYYESGDYKKSWENVHLAIEAGIPENVMSGFIRTLNLEMKDPKNIY